MATGIVCKVWNIQGKTQSKNAKAQLKDSLSYVLNREKTEKRLAMEGTAISNPQAQLGRECRYIENDVKTLGGAYVGSINLISSDMKEAVKEMMDVKEFYNKTDGRAALHGIISLPENESDIRNASKLMQLCEDTLKELFPDNQAIFAIHTNTENLHVHFIVNSVGLNGTKIHQNKNFMRDVMHPCVNKYATKYGFCENEEWKKSYSNKASYADLKIQLRNYVDLAIERADSFDMFIDELNKLGVQANVGKYISLKSGDMVKPIRTHNLGPNYTKDAITERIMTRRDALNHPEIHNYSMGSDNISNIISEAAKIKKYRDMTPKERKRIIQVLRMGKNPWKLQKELNWQVNQANKMLNDIYRVKQITDYYGTDGSVSGAMQGILQAKKQIGMEKRIITRQKQKYKPILDIYEEMKVIEKKAYLYEHDNKSEFRPEFDKYRELTKRLKDGYGKTVDEVAAFANECEERLLYAHAQLHELSSEYRELKQYQNRRGNKIPAVGRLTDILDITAMHENEKKGVYETEVFYAVAQSSQYMLRVTKLPEPDERGTVKEVMKVAVVTRYGEIVDEISSDQKQFNMDVNKLKEKYGFTGDCYKYSDVSTAREFIRVNTENSTQPRASLAQSQVSENDNLKLQGYEFTKAVNLMKDRIHYILDRENPEYIGIVIPNQKAIEIKLVDRLGNIANHESIPSLSEKTRDGFQKLCFLQTEYGFSDDVLSFSSLQEAEMYVEKQSEERKIYESAKL